MQTASRLFLVGIGYRPLERLASEVVRGAEVLLASKRLLDVFIRYDEYGAVRDRVRVIDKVPDTIAFIRENLSRSTGSSVVLLASGDPFFFGIGRRMIEEFGAERVTVLPDLSSMQEAFARINVPWDDAFCISVHGGPDALKRRALPYEITDIPWLVERYGKVAVLTDRQNNPAEIARIMRSVPGSAMTMCVCERLGYTDERIWSGTSDVAAGMTFRDPNVVVLLKNTTGSPETGDAGKKEIGFGLREDELSHARGLITKSEVRAVAIHKLRPPRRGVLWDIGAGSGSISVECARLFPGLRIVAVDRDDDQIGHLKSNRARFDVRNVEILHGEAPDVLADTAAPDRVFIGGSGGQLDRLLAHISGRMLKGIVVVNAITLETLNQAVAGLERGAFEVSVTEVAVSRSRVMSGKRQMTAQNPIFIVTGERAGHVR